MPKTFRPYDPDQMLLMPPSVRDWVPDGDMAHFVSDLVDTVDLSAIENKYEKELRGYPPYHRWGFQPVEGSAMCLVVRIAQPDVACPKIPHKNRGIAEWPFRLCEAEATNQGRW